MKLDIKIEGNSEDYNQKMLTLDTIAAILSSRFDMLMMMEGMHDTVRILKGLEPLPERERAEKRAKEVEEWARDYFSKLEIKTRLIVDPSVEKI